MILSVFDRFLPKKKTCSRRTNSNCKVYKEGDKVFYRNYRAGKTFWEDGTVIKRARKMIYIIKGQNFIGKRHIN